MSDSNVNIHQPTQRRLTKINQHCIHALIAAYFNLMSKLNGINTFSHHVDEVRFLFFCYETISRIYIYALNRHANKVSRIC